MSDLGEDGEEEDGEGGDGQRPILKELMLLAQGGAIGGWGDISRTNSAVEEEEAEEEERKEEKRRNMGKDKDQPDLSAFARPATTAQRIIAQHYREIGSSQNSPTGHRNIAGGGARDADKGKGVQFDDRERGPSAVSTLGGGVTPHASTARGVGAPGGAAGLGSMKKRKVSSLKIASTMVRKPSTLKPETPRPEASDPQTLKP